MSTKFLQVLLLMLLAAFILPSCVSQRKAPCAPEKMRREIKFKGFL